MKWQYKAKIMQICASLPMGDKIYKVIQKNFGNLKANPLSRINMQIEMDRWIREQGMLIEGRTFFEVGTGHKLTLPIGFFISGAKQVITVDLYRRLDFDILQKSLHWMVENRKQLESIYKEVVDLTTLNERLNLLQRLQSDPQKFLVEANIQYLAPADATDTGLPNSSVDYHFSTTVMEHIPPKEIKKIFIEARRILKNDGVAIHFIDCSDHFQHQDNSITKINFLKYTEEQWQRIAGNQFAYCNRLRASEYLRLFSDLSFTPIRHELYIDRDSMNIIERGFLVDQQFSSFCPDDICTTALKVMLRK